ncbi:ribonuclease P protein component [Aureibacter tunicatorum]|uniref:Ribonuclease P protein component n=1 Tax=Aureibacter tunicatorum TaxID=866807 RepID=A0AAE3XJ29_9BACT|nr:ribonuclease P protein component [Aureibacter tunicatorum]MDR6237782.1 ribonuclease P protein component [Aureibacter tunicatorum]BDD02817.1 hypothetical protein AUTU_03000 [Aureibacter tunicatorum]
MLHSKMHGRRKFVKKERLCSKKLIQELFSKGSSFFLYPYKVIYLPVDNAEEQLPHQVLVSVSKRKFKHAVDRNLVKRRIKEAYRLNKHIISPKLDQNVSFLIAFIYVSPKLLPYNEIEPKLKSAMSRLLDTGL